VCINCLEKFSPELINEHIKTCTKKKKLPDLENPIPKKSVTDALPKHVSAQVNSSPTILQESSKEVVSTKIASSFIKKMSSSAPLPLLHSKELATCSLCDAVLKKKNLNDHMKIHKTCLESKFVCVCGKEYSKKCNLKQHCLVKGHQFTDSQIKSTKKTGGESQEPSQTKPEQPLQRKLFYCKYCHFTTPYKNSKQRHEEKWYFPKSFSLCNTAFSLKRSREGPSKENNPRKKKKTIKSLLKL
jgi:hypothetical protein